MIKKVNIQTLFFAFSQPAFAARRESDEIAPSRLNFRRKYCIIELPAEARLCVAAAGRKLTENPVLTERYANAVNACYDRIYANLNPEQKSAVRCVTGPLLVIAGAGSGKTTVLVHRISNIVRFGRAGELVDPPTGGTDADAAELEAALADPEADAAAALSRFAVDPCPPWAVMCITFTNKAANEMKSRLETTLGAEAAGEIWAGTFHNICMRLLRRFHDKAGLAPGFTIYDTDDTKRVLTDVLKRLGIDERMISPKLAASLISRAKESLLTPDDMLREFGSESKMRRVASVYAEYRRVLADANAVDFDDIIMHTVTLLQNDAEVLEYVRRRFRYVCVDEYQDTNKAQFVLTSLLASGKRNLMVVGDDDQSIYRFRGATIENILGFDEEFRDARVIKLERNYRSTSNILGAANAVIANNVGRRGKTLWTENGMGDPVHIMQLSDQNDEARAVADIVLEGLAAGRRLSDYAILYRMNAQSNSFERAFAKSGVAYRVLGGTRFFDRKEIRDVVSYLCVVANPNDALRLKRIINEPKRKIGGATVDALERIANAEGAGIFDVILNAKNYVALERSAARLADFAALITSLRDDVDEGMPTSELVREVLERSGYRAMLEAAGPAEADRLENVDELISNAVEYEQNNEDASLYGFLEDIALVSDIDNYDETADAVVMMTIHSAKGLEFPCVFLPGMEEGMFPSFQSMGMTDEMEEERRLAYVAITRAEKELYCTYARERLLYGKTQFNKISRFLEEIPDEFVEHKRLERPQMHGFPGGRSSFGLVGPGAHTGSRPSAAKPRPAPTSNFIRFKAGDDVEHPTFGHGSVLSVREMGADLLYEIAFDRVGTKKLMATYAKLRRPE